MFEVWLPDPLAVATTIEKSLITCFCFSVILVPLLRAIWVHLGSSSQQRGVLHKRLMPLVKLGIMDGIFDTYLRLWHASPDSLRVATRTGGVYFYLFQDVHETFRKTLIGLIKQVESTDLLLNDSADYTARLIARCAVAAMEVYSDDSNFEALFRETMRGLLLKVGRRRPPSVDVDGDR